MWTQPRLRELTQFELWTALVSVVHNQLIILGVAGLRPWESKDRPVSPKQIRRGGAAIMDELGSVVKRSQSRGKGRVRALSAKIEPALRHKVVKKTILKVNLA